MWRTDNSYYYFILSSVVSLAIRLCCLIHAACHEELSFFLPRVMFLTTRSRTTHCGASSLVFFLCARFAAKAISSK
jgi:hypothetical protein